MLTKHRRAFAEEFVRLGEVRGRGLKAAWFAGYCGASRNVPPTGATRRALSAEASRLLKSKEVVDYIESLSRPKSGMTLGDLCRKLTGSPDGPLGPERVGEATGVVLRAAGLFTGG
jgi:hypothetical protein